MFQHKRGLAGANRRRRAFAPGQETLEGRRLMAANVELSAIQSGRLGTELIGSTANAGAGYTVTDVGNVTGSGYDSYVVAAPSITTGLGVTGSAVYLVFGTKPTTSTTATGIANLTAALRGGDLATLGVVGGTQVNPTVAPTTPATPGFQFDGLKFVTGLTSTGLGSNSQLGISVTPLGDINGDGFADFMVGAANDTGGGREFLIYGGSQLTNQTNKTIDLEPTVGTTSTTTPTKVISFSDANGASSTISTQVGASAAGVRNFFANNGQGLGSATDLAIGEPNGNQQGLGFGTGVVYVLSGVRVNALTTGTNVNLATVGTTGGIGVAFTGANAGDQTGFSLAASGAEDLVTAATAGGPNLLIGAPGQLGSAGRAYLVASNQATPALLALGTTQSLTSVGVVPTTTPTVVTTLTGDQFLGTLSGGQLGYSVSSATDLNDDGVADIALGAPGEALGATGVAANGYVTIVYDPESKFTTQTTTANIYPLVPGTTSTLTIGTAFYTGLNTGDLAGYSLAPVYLASNFSGSSRGLLVGSPGYSGNQGTAFYIPAATAATTVSPTAPVNVSLGTASLFQFTLTPSATNSAAPALSNSASFGNSVSGRPLFSQDTTSSTGDFFFGAPNFSLTNPASAGTIQRSYAGAEFTVSAAALPGNSAGTTTTPTSPTTGTGTTIAAVPFSDTFIQGNPIFTGQFAGEPFPTYTSLTHLTSYKPLPVQLAYQQYRPAPGFAAREENYHHPGKGKSHQIPAGDILGVPQLGRRGENKYNKVFTIPTKVFRRGQTRIGTSTTWTHRSPVIPRSEQTENFPG